MREALFAYAAAVLLHLALLWLDSAPSVSQRPWTYPVPIVRRHDGAQIVLAPGSAAGSLLVGLQMSGRWQLSPADPLQLMFPETRELLCPMPEFVLPN